MREDLAINVELEGTQKEYKINRQFAIKMDVFQSETLKQFLRTSDLLIQCTKDIKAGNRLTKACHQVRVKASSLDTLKTMAVVPEAWLENAYVSAITEYITYWMAPYITLRTSSKNSMSSKKTAQIEVELSVDPYGKEVSGNIKSLASETTLHSIPLPYMEDILPVCTRESQLTMLMQKLSKQGLPSRCFLENNRVKTFDNVKYDYNMGECEHVVFKECTTNPRVEVSVKRGVVYQVVKAVIDGEAYEVKLLKQARGLSTFSAQVTYNGMTKTLTSSSIQKDSTWVLNKHIQVRMFEDGVVELYCSKYGVTVYADTKAVEVKSYKMLLRDRTCGLCGDLNDERTADVKSADECIMSSPVLAAYSFMVKDAACPGVPKQHEKQFMEETKTCKKRVLVPTLL